MLLKLSIMQFSNWIGRWKLISHKNIWFKKGYIKQTDEKIRKMESPTIQLLVYIIILYDFCLPAVFILLIFMSMDARLNMWITASPSCSFISFSNMTSSGNRTLRFPGFCRANTLALRLIMCYLWECYALHGGLELSKILLKSFEKMAGIIS